MIARIECTTHEAAGSLAEFTAQSASDVDAGAVFVMA
jgi:hypothetical protein